LSGLNAYVCCGGIGNVFYLEPRRHEAAKVGRFAPLRQRRGDQLAANRRTAEDTSRTGTDGDELVTSAAALRYQNAPRQLLKNPWTGILLRVR
jgi:hypothetical protein